ncbi:MAG: hypothetical protein PHY93_11035 [Bacteriovorax sp.]|nr:hypothetical protein [Bacteriovorax sp.]
MKNILIASVLMASINFTAKAIECPKYLLECNYQVLENDSYSFVNSKSTPFIGINSDEPSLPADECIASLFFKSKKSGETLNIFVRDDLLTFLYVGYEDGARYPQFYFPATPENEITLSNSGEKMNCVLKDPNAPQD